MVNINGFLKEIRIMKGYSLDMLGDKIGFSKGYLHNVEIGARPVSKKLLEALVRAFPEYKNKLTELYTKDKLPENITFDPLSFKNVTEKINEYSLKVADYYPEGDGRVDILSSKEMKFMLLPEVYENIKKNGYVLKIADDFLTPVFSNGDIVVVEKDNFSNWQALDSRLVLVRINNEYYMRKVFFKNASPFLKSLNERGWLQRTASFFFYHHTL